MKKEQIRVELFLENCQSQVFFSEEDLRQMRVVCERGLALACERARGGVLRNLSRIEVNLVDDKAMGRIHGKFLGDESPTDVLTFDYGEILVGVEVAARQAVEFGSSFLEEGCLYVVHGFCHLSGYVDGCPEERKIMDAVQREILEESWDFWKKKTGG